MPPQHHRHRPAGGGPAAAAPPGPGGLRRHHGWVGVGGGGRAYVCACVLVRACAGGVGGRRVALPWQPAAEPCSAHLPASLCPLSHGALRCRMCVLRLPAAAPASLSRAARPAVPAHLQTRRLRRCCRLPAPSSTSTCATAGCQTTRARCWPRPRPTCAGSGAARPRAGGHKGPADWWRQPRRGRLLMSPPGVCRGAGCCVPRDGVLWRPQRLLPRFAPLSCLPWTHMAPPCLLLQPGALPRRERRGPAPPGRRAAPAARAAPARQRRIARGGSPGGGRRTRAARQAAQAGYEEAVLVGAGRRGAHRRRPATCAPGSGRALRLEGQPSCGV